MKTWVRRAGIGLGALAALGLLAVGGIYGLSAAAVGTGHRAPEHAFDASGGNATEGARLAQLYGCMECHTPDLGGTVLIDGLPFARIPASNLTAGRPQGPLTDQQFERAVRHGVGADGRALFVMPSSDYIYLGDRELADIIAYVRTVPSVERALPARTFGPVGRMLVAVGKVEFEPDRIGRDSAARHLERPSSDDPVQLGYYLTRLCTGCHGAALAGAPPLDPSGPPGANLTPAGNLKSWTHEDFRTFFATGRTPDGREVETRFMPWNVFGKAQPEELDAIWAYLRTLEPLEGPALD